MGLPLANTQAGNPRSPALSAEDYPRVLFLTSSAFNKVTGGGVTFTNLFTGWPADRIATVHNDTVPVSTDVCAQHYKLGYPEIHKRGLLRYLEPKLAPDVDATGKTAEHNGGRLRSIARKAKKIVFGNAVPDVGRLTPELEAWVADYKPDVLYTILGTNAMMDLASALCKRFKLALVIHIMDDWPAIAYRGGLFSFVSRWCMQRSLRYLFGIAAVRMAICEDMAREYERQYGVSFQWFQNPLDSQQWGGIQKQALTVQEPARLAYVGSVLAEAQLSSLADVCAAVASLRKRGMRIEFDIYTPQATAMDVRRHLDTDPSIRLHAALPEDRAVFGALVAADVLVLPVNFDPQTVRYVRLSMPTKVPAYLYSGTPILVYGSDAIAQVKYALREGWGHVVARRGVDGLITAIVRLIEDQALRKKLSEAARSTAETHHGANRVRSTFQRAMRESVST